MDIIKCIKKSGLIECTGLDHLKIRNGVVEIHLKKRTFALFLHGINEVTICSGLEFQVHVWGLEKYMLWLLPPGINHCITLSDVFLDPCSNYVYTVSKTPNACNTISNSLCKLELIKVADALRVPIFILLNIKPSHALPVNVIPYDGVEDRCFARVSELRGELPYTTR